MPRHNVRPKVMLAVADLQTFTAGELLREAGLEHISQAHNQIDRLRWDGYLEQEQLPAVGAYRPLTLYKLTTKPDKRQEFAQEVSQYRPPAPRVPNEAVVRDVLQDARESLNSIEATLNAIGQLPDSNWRPSVCRSSRKSSNRPSSILMRHSSSMAMR